ncbi:MAG: molybdate ABC transporter substrate-binding protein [Paracoccaceae bacterium]|nr:molybdate ABC transporter substrate-binding protein [Paracoccaceae bacterium]MDH5531319.1 molybdate ABC transporter substrate-binding protein [Paracoccaceae bacterium]
MRLVFICTVLLLCPPVWAETARIAVATNFARLAETLADGFNQATGHDVVIIAGATGKLFAQISAGAPFDAFLSADEAAPLELVNNNLADPESRFTYAIGALLLWSPDPDKPIETPVIALSQARYVAIANPLVAPYGKAAMQSIAKLELTDDLSTRIVMGENIGQTFTMVQSGAADIGFVAASSIKDADMTAGSFWPVPQTYHDPIRQDAVLLVRGRGNQAAIGFLDYLRTPSIRDAIRAAGYEDMP